MTRLPLTLTLSRGERKTDLPLSIRKWRRGAGVRFDGTKER
jgi:hypothetical protein